MERRRRCPGAEGKADGRRRLRRVRVEPPPDDHPLFKMDTFVGTPHMSAHTEEAMIRMSMVAKDVIAVLEGRDPEFPVP